MKKLPSSQKKWVKNEYKVVQALNDLQENHNHSWYRELRDRNKNNSEGIAIFYRGNEITYREMFDAAMSLAKSMKAVDISNGDEIIACVANIPECIYLMLAANCIGAVVNFVSASFEKDCLLENIGTSNELLVISDNYCGDFANKVSIDSFTKCVVIPLSNSLPQGKNPFSQYDNEYCNLEDFNSCIAIDGSRVYEYGDFIKLGEKYEGIIEDLSVGLDTEFTVTYTSGSTKIGWPKAIIHTNRSYISIGRFHDPDISLMPAMRNMRGLAHIPTHSNTDLVSSISDPLMQTCTVACEPIYNKKFFARSLAINKPGFAPATRSFWVEAVKQMEKDPLLEKIDLSLLVNATSVGEDISRNEERYINACFRKHKAGNKVIPGILGNTVISIGGGNCEHGGLFFTLLKSKRELFKKDYGLVPFQLVDMAILKPDGTECDYGELGLLVANSVCTMKEYKNNKKATAEFYIKDAYGRVWGNCNVWAIQDSSGRIHMRGRVGNEVMLDDKRTIPMFQISDFILSDSRVLSCETVMNHAGNIISYVELVSDEYKQEELRGYFQKLIGQKLGSEFLERYDVRFIDIGKSYVLTGSGKRNIAYLENI